MEDFGLLVNSCDKFEDCWDPFFKLFSIYWPECSSEIYLNTERKDYTYGELNIVPVKCAENEAEGTRLTWSECLLKALDKIDSDIILYMQEDYFLKDYVKHDLVNKYVQLMLENEDIDCIHLTDQALQPQEDSSEYEKLYPVITNQRYHISCQAALWRKKTLRSYLRPYESAWEFEEFGSKRASILKPSIYTVDKQWVKLGEFEIIPYIFTGIVQGRWKEEVVALFDKHNIEMDYSKRGFLNDVPDKSFKSKVFYKVERIPTWFKSWYDLFKLKLTNVKAG